ncbi:MAG: TAXI family TRAP transporter solute-binding subunit [Rhodospirillales bacterium]|nr:TAXI family TRAP transporter solute-binding subunit [Rhodospirillales bacterium]
MKALKLLITLVVGLGFVQTAQAQEIIGVATGQQGSLGFKTGAVVAKLLNTKMGIKARTQPQAGVTAYIPLINKGEMHFGYSNAVEATFAFHGEGTFKGKENAGLRLIGMMFPLRTGLMVAKDKGIETIQDLAKHKGNLRIASEYTASTIIPYYIAGALANGGLTYDDFKKVPVSSFVKGMASLGEDKADITLISLGSGASHKVSSQLRSRGGITYVSLDTSPDAFKRFQKFLPAATIISMGPNKKFPGLDSKKNIIEIPWMMLTSDKVSDELAYRVTKAIAENKDELAKSFGAFNGANMKKMAPKISVPYHPGSIKYFKEAGIAVNG